MNRDVEFGETRDFHEKAFERNGLGLDNWTLKTPFDIIRDTQGEEAAEKRWETLRDTGGSGWDALWESARILNEMGKNTFSPDASIADRAKEWMDSAPGTANWDQIGRFLDSFWEKLKNTHFDDFDGMGDPFTGLPWPGVISDDVGDAPDFDVITIRYVDPLILDLDGDGLEITRLDRQVLFDANGDGIRTGTAWASADDGLVVWDRNGNGTIDSGAELFGDETVLSNGQKAADGFAALTDLDSNADGRFDAQDTRFADLRIWRDFNQDGTSQAAELRSLGDSGVRSIQLAGQGLDASVAADPADAPDAPDAPADASSVQATTYTDAVLVRAGSFTRTDGSSGQAGSFNLAQNSFIRAFVPIAVSEAASALPAVRGTGWVRDLREAATVNPELIALLDAAKNASTRAGYKEGVSDLLRAWGNDSAYESASRAALAHGYGLVMSDPLDDQERGWMDVAIKAGDAERDAFRATLSAADLARFDGMRERMVGSLEELHAYEAFTGHTFLNWTQVEGDALHYEPRILSGGGRVPVEVTVPFSQIVLEHRNAVMSSQAGYIRVDLPTPPSGAMYTDALWSRLVDDASNNLMPVVRLAGTLDLVELQIDSRGLSLDFGALDSRLASAAAADVHEGATLFLDLHHVYGRMLDGMGWNGSEQLRALMQQGVADADVRSAFAETGLHFVAADGSPGTEAADAFAGSDGADWFNAGAGDDLIDGAAGDDGLYAGAGRDMLFGGEGADMLYGDDGDDVLDGGAGDDSLVGGEGSDLYRFARGWGHDTLSNYDPSAGRLDAIEFAADIGVGDIAVSREADNLVLRLDGHDDMLTVNWYFDAAGNSDGKVDEIRFAEGTVWDHETIKARVLQSTGGDDTLRGYATADHLTGGEGNDSLFGLVGDDTLDGGSGTDYLQGGDGADALLGGTGEDVLYGGADNDTLSGQAGDDTLVGEDGADTLYGGAGNDNLSGGDGSDVYRFARGWGQDNLVNYDVSEGRVDAIEFAAGIDASDIVATRAGDNLVLALRGSTDSVTAGYYFNADGTGGYAVDQIRFADGTAWDYAAMSAQVQQATESDDVLYGYASADVLSGDRGNDVLYGHDGDDALDGGAGNDSLQGGSGTDILRGEAGTDTLSGGAGNDLLQGGTGSDALSGDEGSDVLEGGAGSDTLNGGEGSDVYRFSRGWGQDTIYNYDLSEGRFDAIEFAADVAATDIVATRVGDSLVLGLKGSTDRVTVAYQFDPNGVSGYAVDEIRFSDGTRWDTAAIEARAADAEPEPPVTWLQGSAGADTYVLRRGSGHQVVSEYDADASKLDSVQLAEGIAHADVAVWRDGYDLCIAIDGATSTDRLDLQNYFYQDGMSGYAVENIRFADGTTWDLETIKARVVEASGGDDWLTGYASDDLLAGLDGADTIFGGEGGDQLDGGADADLLYGEAGDDTLVGGTQDDRLYGGEGADRMMGGAGNDALSGDAGDDQLDGGTGNDMLDGGTGSDTYRFGRGSGHDIVSEYDTVEGNTDTVAFGSDVAASDVIAWRDGDTLNLSIGGPTSSDRLELQNYFYQEGTSGYAVESIRFADGTVWNHTTIDSQVQSLVQAMASFAPAAAGQTNLSAGYHANLDAALAANWH